MAIYIKGKVLDSNLVEQTGMYKTIIDQGTQFSTICFTYSPFMKGEDITLQVYIKAKQTPDKSKSYLSVAEVPDRYKEPLNP